jgi:flagellar motor switch protein FliM
MSRLLSQNEVDAVLGQEGTGPEGVASEPIPFDLSSPPVLAGDRLLRANARAEALAASLARAVARAARLDPAPTLEFSGLQQLPAREMIGSLQDTTAAAPLRRGREAPSVVIALDPRVAETLAERLLGGPGESVEGERGLSEVECRVLGHLTAVVGKTLTDALPQPGAPDLETGRVRPCPAGVLPADGGTLVALTYRLDLAGGSGALQILLSPEEALVLAQPEIRTEDATDENERVLLLALGMTVRATPAISGGCMAMTELLALQAGDVIRLDALKEEPIRLVINGRPLFDGHLRARSGRSCFEVTGTIGERSAVSESEAKP